MNYSIIKYIFGWVMLFESAFMLMPVTVAVYYGERQGLAFLACSFIFTFLGWLCMHKKPDDSLFYAREGFVAVAGSWIILSLIGALPFYITKEIPSYTDALFEIISGFTTTGASILTEVEGLSHCILFWRSFSHWIGGMGVLVFILAILPLAGGHSLHIMKAESPGPTVGKLVPKLQKTAFYLYSIYFAMTIIEILLLLAGKMPIFDSVCTAFGTAGTGGFGIKNDSIAGYSSYLQGVITVFMFLFGVNFNFYFLLLLKKFKDAFNMEEVKWYFIIYIGAVVLITINLTSSASQLFENLHHAAFQVSSIMTTTGFATTNFDNWPTFSKTILVALMFIGACAGSTGGGMKVSRIVLWIKTMLKEVSCQTHPHNIKIVKMDDKPVNHTTVRTANNFLIAYAIIFIVSTLIISLDNFSFTTNFSAVAATFNNIGPGLELVGPTGNFSMFSGLSKYVLMFDMLAGRLEVFPMLVLFAPATWKLR